MVIKGLDGQWQKDILVGGLAKLVIAAFAPRVDTAGVGDGNRVHAATRKAYHLLVAQMPTDPQWLDIDVLRRFSTENAMFAVAPTIQSTGLYVAHSNVRH
jgi:hypothetical protein